LKSESNTMGRPREFDEREVLEAASDAFWVRGYGATSTRDLVKATGLTQPSLYNAFGDKRGLFRAALAHYLMTLSQRIARLDASFPPALAVTMFLHEIVERSVSDPQKRGCMLVNSALEVTPEDEDLRTAIADELEKIRAFFERCVAAAQARGDAPPVLPARDASRHLLAILLGVRVLARIAPDRTQLVGTVAPALTLLGLPALPGGESSG
jgi:TetR/AcrR family transcriptional repressor of nem operon